jgi:hypothetical protein
MGMQRGFNRSTCTRTRYGVADITIDPAWLRVHPTGNRKVIITGGQEVGITAEVRVRATADVRPLDFLYFADLNLRMIVYQIIPEQATARALCQEVPQFIPDEFNRIIVEEFWTQTLNGGAITADEFGFLEIAMPAPGSHELGQGARLTQLLAGDFDVVAKLDTVSPLGTYRYVTGLIAYQDATHYCAAVRVGDNTLTPNTWLTRVDKVGASYDDEDNVEATSGAYLRIRRIGNVLTCFYSAVTTAAGPTSESDWGVLESTGDRFFSSAALAVGLAGYRVGSAQTAEWDWIKPWLPTA